MTRHHPLPTPTTYAYKGYLMCRNPLNGLWWIEKDGQHISYVTDEAHAKHTIDALCN